MTSLFNKAVCCLLSPVLQGRASPLYLAVLIDKEDTSQVDLHWKLRAFYQEGSEIILSSGRYFLLVITLDDNREPA
jgi:hypothetical protein